MGRPLNLHYLPAIQAWNIHFGFNILSHNAKREEFIYSVRSSLPQWS